MEARFIEIGKEHADWIRDHNPSIQFNDYLDQDMAETAWAWFLASMSDDYSKTLREQSEIARNIRYKIERDAGTCDIVHLPKYQKK